MSRILKSSGNGLDYPRTGPCGHLSSGCAVSSRVPRGVLDPSVYADPMQTAFEGRTFHDQFPKADGVDLSIPMWGCWPMEGLACRLVDVLIVEEEDGSIGYRLFSLLGPGVARLEKIIPASAGPKTWTAGNIDANISYLLTHVNLSAEAIRSWNCPGSPAAT